jgi:hypothetical protein
MVGNIVTKMYNLNSYSFVEEKFSVRIPAVTPANLTSSFRGFRQSLQEKFGIVID